MDKIDHTIRHHIDDPELYYAKERLYDSLRDHLGESGMTVDGIIRAILTGTGEEHIFECQKLNQKTESRTDSLTRLVPPEVAVLILDYRKSLQIMTGLFVNRVGVLDDYINAWSVITMYLSSHELIKQGKLQGDMETLKERIRKKVSSYTGYVKEKYSEHADNIFAHSNQKRVAALDNLANEYNVDVERIAAELQFKKALAYFKRANVLIKGYAPVGV